MRETRTQTGHIARKRYDSLTLQMQSTQINSPTSPSSGPISPSKVSKKTRATKGAKKEPVSSKTNEARKCNIAAKSHNENVSILNEPSKPQGKRFQLESGLPGFDNPTTSNPKEQKKYPNTTFGEKETVGLSIIGRADREVRIWEEVLKQHQEELPELAETCQRSLDAAKAARAALPSTEENLRIGVPNPEQAAIAARIKTLQWALDTSKFEPERQNIAAAITGYKNGQIGFVKHYTLIWAGQIVDTADTYGDFVVNRNERLDAYAEKYGPHWLWYETPLNQHPEALPKLFPSVCLQQTDNTDRMGCYYLKQGFWKRSGFVTRLPLVYGGQVTDHDATFVRNADGEVYAGLDGPRLHFRTLLDSGASFPSVHTEDLAKLGIDPMLYSAQSVGLVMTANGTRNLRIFEMVVSILDHDNRQLVNSEFPMWPAGFPQYLGGLVPVFESANQMQYDLFGNEIPNRLSGILPFVACYLASAPTTKKLHLGEDRRDVLGVHRMPGGRRWDWDVSDDFKLPFALTETQVGSPTKITFEHANGRLINTDDDVLPHVSHTTAFPGTEQQQVHTMDPNHEAVGILAFKMLKERVFSIRAGSEGGDRGRRGGVWRF